MDDRKATGLKVWTPLIFSLVLIAGMTLGFNLRDTLRNKRDIQTIIERNDRLEQIIDLVNERYVDSVNSNDLYRDAVNGILSHLDPHTIYIPADELQGVNEDLEGSFYGIGVEFAVMRDTILVTSVIPSGPAEKAGIHTGDKIVKVDDSIVAGKDLPSDHVVRMLKGKQNTNVIVGLKDIETGGMKTVTIRRDAIPVYSVDANLMLDEVTGYIKISRFSANTYDEFAKAVKNLKASGMQQLIIDVRLNPGGYLESARDIVDDLLPGEKMVVYTKGRNSSLREYKTRDKDLFERGKVAILIDERSASASEILAGAVQDWDRGIIVGRRSYGKGLVQEQYDMDDGAALRLTIAKYYTPSGRSIQRPYAKGRDAYEEDFSHRYETGELVGIDTVMHDDTVKFYTANKRVVYGGGGIKPDVYVPYDTARLTPGVANLLYSEDVRNVVWDYFMKHRQQLRQYKNIKEYIAGFRADALVDDFIARQDPGFRKAVVKVMRLNNNYAFFSQQLKAQMGRVLFKDNGYYAVQTLTDDVVIRARESLKDPRYSTLIRR